jgi:hypothetical protein
VGFRTVVVDKWFLFRGAVIAKTALAVLSVNGNTIHNFDFSGR